MRCLNCDYVLWNLPARECPECGTTFAPSQYEFARNTVRFCCPHCDQDYFGTGEKGHLVPREFTCVRCQKPVRMNDMVLRPAEGIEDHQTMADANPWLERQRNGRIKSWFKAVGWSLIAPGRLMKATSPSSSLGQASWFAIVSGVLPLMIIFVPLMLILTLIMGFAANQGGGPGAGMMMGIMGGTMAAMGVGVVVSTFIFLGLWGLATHGLLRLGGPLEHGLGRTYQALCYSAGVNALNALMFCGGHYAASVWWMVSATIMVKEGHRVSGGRAAFAVLTGPVLLIVTTIVAYGLFVASVLSGAGAFGVNANMSVQDTQNLTASILNHANANNGTGPDHALRFIANDGYAATDFLDWDSNTYEEDVPVGSGTLSTVDIMNSTEKTAMAQAAADALPVDVVAHRLGDFVFTYHDIDLNIADPGLWVVILSFDPDAMVPGDVQSWVWVGLADGATTSFSAVDFQTVQLPAQNLLRQSAGLPNLPDPSTVTHANPAVASP